MRMKRDGVLTFISKYANFKGNQMKNMKEKEIKEKQDEEKYKRVVDEEESNQMEDAIKEMVEQFISTNDDPMGSILKLL